MTKVLISRIQLFFILVILSTLVGVFDGYRFPLEEGYTRAQVVFASGFYWFLGSSITWAFEIFFINSHYGNAIRRLHFVTAIAVKSVILVIIVTAAAFIGQTLLQGITDLKFVTDPWFHQILIMVFMLVIVLQTITQVVRIIGGRTLIYFLLGKYHQPVKENMIFMFLDLEGSTGLAVKLGDIGVQKMITKFFFDINEPIIENDGEIHRYIGDEVIVTWPLKEGENYHQAFDCYFAITDLMAEKATVYQETFGVTPTFRIGLHGGPVVMSECGDQKQEISYFGDTINTAARIEQLCKDVDCSLLISGELLDKMTLPDSYIIRSVGSHELRGRAKKTDLFTIERV